MAFTFRGGVHIPEHKDTNTKAIRRMPLPDTVSISLSQHIGRTASPLVKVGDVVDRGQLIGEVENALGCPIHSSVSGTVKAIEEVVIADGTKIGHITIENDHCDRLSPDIKSSVRKLNDITAGEVIEIVKNAGISGMGGASFPTYAKIQSALGKVKHLIVNCAECEPYITANHRLLLEKPEEVINGIKILLKTFGLRKGIIAIEDNKLDAADRLSEVIGESALVEIRIMKTKYPQGDERQLIYALTGKELPTGKLPADLGCVVFNAETVSAIFNAVFYGMPAIDRIVTVAGDCVRHPQNVFAPIGASFENLIEFCGGLVKDPYKMINGGPMMGFAQWDFASTVKKGTSAILLLSEEMNDKYNQPSVCIHCGRCLTACPMRLMPNYLASFSKAEELDESLKFGIMSCIECGSCAYVCPGKVPIVQYIKTTKLKIRENTILQQAVQNTTSKKG